MRSHLLTALIIGGVVLYVVGATAGPEICTGLGVVFVVVGMLLRILGWAEK